MRKYIFFSIIEKVGLAGLKFSTLLLISRALGAEGQGKFTFVLSIWNLSAVIGAFGMDIANNYYGAQYIRHPENAEHPLSDLLGNSLVWILSSSMLIGFCVSLAPLEMLALEGIPRWQLAAGTFATMSYVLLSNLLYGIGRFQEKALGDFLHFGGFLMILVAMFTAGELNSARIVPIWLMTQFSTCLVWTWILLVRASHRIRVRRITFSAQLSYGSRAYLYNLSNALNFRLDSLIIGSALGTSALGVYSVAVSFTEVILYIPKVLTNATLTTASHTGEAPTRMYSYLSAAIVLAAVFVCVAGYFLIVPMFGLEFKQSVWLMPFHAIGIIGIGIGNVAAYHLFGIGRSDLSGRNAVISAASAICLYVTLIPMLGLSGGAMATMIAYLIFGTLNIRDIASAINTPVWQLLIPNIKMFRGDYDSWRTQSRAHTKDFPS